jgi:hypothetical protein
MKKSATEEQAEQPGIYEIGCSRSWIGSVGKITTQELVTHFSEHEALYNHAIQWEFADKNLITDPVRGSGVPQGAKPKRIPNLLGIDEFQHLQADLRLRERILVWLDMTSGLRGELAGSSLGGHSLPGSGDHGAALWGRPGGRQRQN